MELTIDEMVPFVDGIMVLEMTLRKQVFSRVPTLTTFFQHSFGSVGHSNQGRKRSKRNPDRKRRSETRTVC